MIIERINAVSVIPPRVVLTRVAVGRMSHEVETTSTIASGERQIAEGASGTVIEAYSDIEVGFCSAKDLIVFSQQRQLRPR